MRSPSHERLLSEDTLKSIKLLVIIKEIAGRSFSLLPFAIDFGFALKLLPPGFLQKTLVSWDYFQLILAVPPFLVWSWRWAFLQSRWRVYVRFCSRVAAWIAWPHSCALCLPHPPPSIWGRRSARRACWRRGPLSHSTTAVLQSCMPCWRETCSLLAVTLSYSNSGSGRTTWKLNCKGAVLLGLWGNIGFVANSHCLVLSGMEKRPATASRWCSIYFSTVNSIFLYCFYQTIGANCI